MDINSFIQDRVTEKNVGNTVDMITFNLVHAMDKEHIHIPDWHKEPISVFDDLGEYYEDDGLGDIPDKGNLVLTRFGIVELSLETLMILSNILPTPDILEHIKLETTNPYTSPKNPQLQNYNLFGNL